MTEADSRQDSLGIPSSRYKNQTNVKQFNEFVLIQMFSMLLKLISKVWQKVVILALHPSG